MTQSVGFQSETLRVLRQQAGVKETGVSMGEWISAFTHPVSELPSVRLLSKYGKELKDGPNLSTLVHMWDLKKGDKRLTGLGEDKCIELAVAIDTDFVPAAVADGITKFSDLSDSAKALWERLNYPESEIAPQLFDQLAGELSQGVEAEKENHGKQSGSIVQSLIGLML